MPVDMLSLSHVKITTFNRHAKVFCPTAITAMSNSLEPSNHVTSAPMVSVIYNSTIEWFYYKKLIFIYLITNENRISTAIILKLEAEVLI